MALDIGMVLFRDVLKMAEYPNYPFSGIILNDLVMFFLIPTIFIILILYMAVGRVVGAHPGLRLLVGLGAYLFIIFGGYYGTFARIAGPYFIFLIFILGLLYFILDHFHKKPAEDGRGPTAYSSGGLGGMSSGNVSSQDRKHLFTLEKQTSELKAEKERLQREIMNAQTKGWDTKVYAIAYNTLTSKVIQLKEELEIEKQNTSNIRHIEEGMRKFQTKYFGR
ncbi:MAG: hypothetical protein HZB65_00415 [Candidatus Aenigmarchaeota archaeon]|nr:hypothetical protein [Candidatus Aenigmarchaeota archaeon]